jgi:hypothetical protein
MTIQERRGPRFLNGWRPGLGVEPSQTRVTGIAVEVEKGSVDG